MPTQPYINNNNDHYNEQLTLHCKTKLIETLNCTTLNGLKCRLNYPEFREMIQSYDILCVPETETGPSDIFLSQTILTFRNIENNPLCVKEREYMYIYQRRAHKLYYHH